MKKKLGEGGKKLLITEFFDGLFLSVFFFSFVSFDSPYLFYHISSPREHLLNVECYGFSFSREVTYHKHSLAFNVIHTHE